MVNMFLVSCLDLTGLPRGREGAVGHDLPQAHWGVHLALGVLVVHPCQRHLGPQKLLLWKTAGNALDLDQVVALDCGVPYSDRQLA